MAFLYSGSKGNRSPSSRTSALQCLVLLRDRLLFPTPPPIKADHALGDTALCPGQTEPPGRTSCITWASTGIWLPASAQLEADRQGRPGTAFPRCLTVYMTSPREGARSGLLEPCSSKGRPDPIFGIAPNLHGDTVVQAAIRLRIQRRALIDRG